MPALTQLGRSGSTARAGRVPPGREGSAASGSSVLAGVLGFFVYLLKMIIVFFFHKGTSIFAKERGKLFQLKQDKTFQAGVILASHFQSVFLPSVGWLSWNMGSEGAMPLPPLLIPVLATLILHFFLELPARTWETFPPTCMIFRSGTHSLFFILFSNKGSDIPISQSGSLVAVLSQAWRAWDPDHWLKWSLRNVSEVLIAVPYPSFSTPALGEKKTCIKGPLWVRHWRQSL